MWDNGNRYSGRTGGGESPGYQPAHWNRGECERGSEHGGAEHCQVRVRVLEVGRPERSALIRGPIVVLFG